MDVNQAKKILLHLKTISQDSYGEFSAVLLEYE